MTTRKIAVLMSLVGLVIAGAGCMSAEQVHNYYPHSKMQTLTQSGKDHEHSVIQVLRQDERSLAEDLDLLFMTDRPSRLNRWHSK